MSATINEQLLEEKLVEIEKAKAWSPRTIAKLETLPRSGDDLSLFRINPVKFGKERNIAEQEAIDLFLYGTKCGLFQMNWQLLCPGCADVIESFGALNHLHSHCHCSLCQADYSATLDDYIAITFTIAPQIREIIYHHPESLSVEEYYFNYIFSHDALLPDGRKFVDLVREAAFVLEQLNPKEKKRIEREVKPGFFSGADMMTGAEIQLNISGELQRETQHFSVKLVDGKFEPAVGTISPGKVVFECENTTEKRGSILLMFVPPGSTPPNFRYEPFLSGKKLLTTQTFRDLFHSEVLRANESLAVKDITILFSDLKGSTMLYDRIGDLNAYSLVQQHFDSLEKVIRGHAGALTKTIGDAVMASFSNPVDAISAAIGMLREIEQFNRDRQSKDIILKIGVHKGSSIVVNSNDRLDYFGQTVNIASRVQELAGAEEICFTQDVFSFPGVEQLLNDFKVETRTAKLRGIGEEMQVHKIAGT